MAIKRPLVNGLLAALALTLIPTDAVSAQKVTAGSACKVSNQKIDYLGKTYTCIKFGKKLIWSKGVLVVKATPKPSTTPLPTPKIDPVQAQLDSERLNFKDEMIFRIDNGILERQASNKLFFKSDSRPSTSFDPVRVSAFTSILSHKSAPTHSNIVIDYQISPSFPKPLVDYSVNQVEESANYWNSVLDVPTSFTVKLITEKDRESALKDPLMYSGMDQALDRLAAWDPSTQQIFFTGGGGYLPDRSDSKFKGLLMIATSSKAYPERMNFEWPATVSHEVTHIIQGYFFKDRLPTLTSDQYQSVSPDNFREGNANLVGYAVSLGFLGWYSDELDKNLYNCITSVGNWARAENEADIIKLLIETEIRTPEEAHTMAYPMGALLYEWVLYKYGYDKVIDIFKGQGTSADYTANIYQSLNVTKDQLYKEAAPYILLTIKRVLSK
jgi:hypothetical protein